MTLRLILFDCDGTLVDSAAVIVQAMRRAFEACDAQAPSDAAIRAIIGLSLPAAVQALATHEPGAPVDALVAAYRDAYRDSVVDQAAEPVFPGIHDALSALDRPDTLFGIVTGKSRRGLERVLSAHALAQRFVVTRTADDAASKPAPDMVLQALAQTGAEAAQTVVIGDTTFDIEMARAAGAHALGVGWGNHAPQLILSSGAAAVAAEAAELPDLVARVLAQGLVSGGPALLERGS